MTICQSCGNEIELEHTFIGQSVWRLKGAWEEISKLHGYVYRDNDPPYDEHQPPDALTQALWDLTKKR